jgi:FKBP-type peptidyl-prolyl cis-trans isomerase
MLLRFACLATIALFPQILFADPQTSNPATLDLNNASDQQKLSYILGMEMLEERSRQGFVLDPDMVAQAIRDEQAGVQPNLSMAEYIRIVTIKREKVAEFEARWQGLSDNNLEAGNAFMKAMALEPGVVSTESGLLYKILRPGTGERPSADDIARIHYRGTMLNGEEFDSSYKRDEPAEFPVGKVKPALREILLLMREGAKWVFYSPPSLAYGEEGGGPIGPNETLITEVELLEILK